PSRPPTAIKSSRSTGAPTGNKKRAGHNGESFSSGHGPPERMVPNDRSNSAAFWKRCLTGGYGKPDPCKIINPLSDRSNLSESVCLRPKKGCLMKGSQFNAIETILASARPGVAMLGSYICNGNGRVSFEANP